MLKGKKITDDLLEEASTLASKETKPVANVVSAFAPYRKDMARVMTKRAIKEAMSM